MKWLRYAGWSFLSCGLAMLLTLMHQGTLLAAQGSAPSGAPVTVQSPAPYGPFRVAVDPEYPDFFGDASKDTLDRILNTIDGTRQAQLGIAVGSSIIIGSADAEAMGAAVALCLLTPDNCPNDVSLQADAMRGLDQVAMRRVRDHIIMLTITGGEPLNDQERDFWDAFLEATEDPARASEILQQSGVSHGDPHIITFDNFHYSFQTVGEYTLVKSVDGVFEVQARQSREPDRQVSLNTAVAIRLGRDRATLYVQNFPDGATDTPLRINGQPTNVGRGGLELPGGGEIRRDGNHYVAIAPTGEQVRVDFHERGDFPFLNITVSATDTPDNDFYRGIFGNYNQNDTDDLQTRNGRTIPSRSTYGDIADILSSAVPINLPLNQVEQAYFEQLYRDFGNSWRISQAESLFDYAPGQTTATFTEGDFPSTFLSLRSLAPAQLREAEAICQDEGVDDLFIEGCIFDVAATEDRSFAEAAGELVVNWVVEGLRDRVEDEVRDRLPIPNIRLPF